MTEKQQNKKPSFFRSTKYQEPNDEELKEIHQAKCSEDELRQGLGYAIIGRGIERQQEKDMIISSIERLLKLEPDNEQYKIALKNEKESPLHRVCYASVQKKADYPEHPDQLVVKKNEYFSNGVREIDIWNYYDGIKNKLISEFKGKDLFVVMAIKPDSEMYIRHPYDKKTEYIRINSLSQFEEYHTGKTAEYHITSPEMTDEAVFDFDPGSKATFNDIKNVVGQCVEFIKKQKDFKSKIEIRFTGKRSFHVQGTLKSKRKISDIKKDVEGRLQEYFKDSNDVVVAKNKPSGTTVNIDLSPMKRDGGHIAPYSLRIKTGLVCVPVTSLKGFKKEDAKLDKVYKKITGKSFKWNFKKKSSYLMVLEEINKFGWQDKE